MEKKKKIFLGSGIAVICLIGMIYLAFSLFFRGHFYFGTMIGEIECGGKTAAEAERLIGERVAEYTLEIQGREADAALLMAAEINLTFSPGNVLEEMVKEQNGFEWLSFLWKRWQYEMPMMVKYDRKLLDQRIGELFLMQEKNMREPRDAYIGEYDEELGKYPMVEEDKGTYLVYGKVTKAAAEAVENMDEVLILEEAGCYKEAAVTQNDPKLCRFWNRLNRYVSAKIVYDWHGFEEIIDGKLISQWLEIDRDTLSVGISSQTVREYINELSRKYDTYGKIRKFTTHDGDQIYIRSGNYGWQVNRKKETERLVKAIRAGRSEVREPEYLFTANAKGENDIGDSYVEIDLGRQCLYLYAEGKLVTETELVSGNVSRGFTTPDGIYGLTYKTQNATLKGQGYRTPVKYWMPFNGNIGMHDASWRREFGKDIYLNGGSHGCINLPPKEAEKIYEYVYKGFPVICYTYEKEENNGQD